MMGLFYDRDWRMSGVQNTIHVYMTATISEVLNLTITFCFMAIYNDCIVDMQIHVYTHVFVSSIVNENKSTYTHISTRVFVGTVSGLCDVYCT